MCKVFIFKCHFCKGEPKHIGEVWRWTVEEKEYRVSNQKPTKFNYKAYQGNADNPIEDKNLISALNDCLDEVMYYVVAEASSRITAADLGLAF